MLAGNTFIDEQRPGDVYAIANKHKLSPRAWTLLKILFCNLEQPFSYQQLMDYFPPAEQQQIMNGASEIRSALTNLDSNLRLRTIHGHGLVLEFTIYTLSDTT